MKIRTFLLIVAIPLWISSCTKGCDEETPTEPKTTSPLSSEASYALTKYIKNNF